MKLNEMLKLMGLLGAFTLAVGCAGPAEKAEQSSDEPTRAESVSESDNEAPFSVSGSSDSDSYEVSRGDHLWGISGSTYGNPYKWPLIYKANSDKIKDADLIYPGQVLDIDTSPSSSDTAAAINHAKSRGSWSLGDSEASDQDYLSQ